MPIRLILLCVLLCAPAPLTAAQAPYRAGSIEVTSPWVRAMPAAAPTAAGYARIVNRGHVLDRLISASSLVTRAVELHQMSMAGGVMRMRPLAGGVAIPPGGAIALTPGGDHLMLIGPAHVLRAGEKVPVILDFARAGRLTVEFEVRRDPPVARSSR